MMQHRHHRQRRHRQCSPRVSAGRDALLYLSVDVVARASVLLHHSLHARALPRAGLPNGGRARSPRTPFAPLAVDGRERGRRACDHSCSIAWLWAAGRDGCNAHAWDGRVEKHRWWWWWWRWWRWHGDDVGDASSTPAAPPVSPSIHATGVKQKRQKEQRGVAVSHLRRR